MNALGNRGVLLVGHGTRDLVGTEQFFHLADRLASQIAPIPVQPCLLELQSPDIAEGWTRLMACGVRHISVVPLLLFTAGHARHDIPDAVRKSSLQHPASDGSPLTIGYSRPLSRHPAIVKLAIHRIEAVASRQELQSGETAVIMIGRGSHDPCARTDMMLFSEIVRRHFQAQHWGTGFYAMAHPRLPEVLEQISKIGQVKRVVVYPHLLFEGLLYQAIASHVAAHAATSPEKQYKVTGYLGPVKEVCDALWDRAQMETPLIT